MIVYRSSATPVRASGVRASPEGPQRAQRVEEPAPAGLTPRGRSPLVRARRFEAKLHYQAAEKVPIWGPPALPVRCWLRISLGHLAPRWKECAESRTRR